MQWTTDRQNHQTVTVLALSEDEIPVIAKHLLPALKSFKQSSINFRIFTKVERPPKRRKISAQIRGKNLKPFSSSAKKLIG